MRSFLNSKKELLKKYRHPIAGVLCGCLCFIILVSLDRTAWSPSANILPPVKSKITNLTVRLKLQSPLPISPVVSQAVDQLQHQDIVTTIFWVGEAADGDNGYIANRSSAWDEKWLESFGGTDNQASRNGYYPAGFTPKENAFYFALPYNDVDEQGNRKSTASNCTQTLRNQNYSWCKNTWIKIQFNGKIAYAQWEDVGPYLDDDVAYVFGNATPSNKHGQKAGLDVSPAVQTYLGLKDVSKTNWQFVTFEQVPSGPWKQNITTSLGRGYN